MSTPVAQYLVCQLVLSDVAVSLQNVEPGQARAWDGVDERVNRRDNQDAFEQTNTAIMNAGVFLRERMLDHLEAEARQIIRGKAGAK